jgi:hypothetical protein
VAIAPVMQSQLAGLYTRAPGRDRKWFEENRRMNFAANRQPA